MDYYQFKSADAFDFIHTNRYKARQKGDELIFKYCPFCNPSDKETFSINLTTGVYNCLRASCGAKGTFRQLAEYFNFPLPHDAQEYYGISGTRYRTYNLKHIEIREPAARYLKSRGISEEVSNKYEITTQRDADNILVIPFRDEKGIVQCVKYRKTDFNKEVDKCKEWFDYDKEKQLSGKMILFGMNHCDVSNDTLVFTEGQLDALSLATAGIPNPVSVPTGQSGTTWIPHCWDFVNQFQTIIVFGDCEKGHITLVDMVKGRFPNLTVKVVRENDYQGCKDANEILQTYGEEQLRKAVENAEPLPVASLVDVFDVPHVNLLNMEALPTRITCLDKLLVKGFYYGQVVLLTGNRGDGKSTFMQQICCNAIDQGVKTFLYSGELPNNIVRNFTDTMLAGKHESEIRQEYLDKMVETYHGMMYLYDFSVVEHNEQEDVMRIAEQAIKQYGCRLICFDNLMTMVSAANNDTLYQAQKEFVDRLVKMAKLHNVIIMLVAHPRKRGVADNSTFNNDDISGSGDVANRVDVIMSYQRLPKKKGEEEDDSKRVIWVTKNRLTGKLATGDKALKVKYEPGTRRITDEDSNFGWRCRWDADEPVVRAESEPEPPVQYDYSEIPF